MTSSTMLKDCQWEREYIIDNLPAWIYSDNPQPRSLEECEAKIASLEYTIQNIDLQIEIRDLEFSTGHSRHTNNFDFQKWKVQALKAKQTHLYLLNAYTYWLLLNKQQETTTTEINKKLTEVIKLLISEPDDFVPQLQKLL